MPGYIKVIVNNRMGIKAEVMCSHDDTIKVLKMLIQAQTGIESSKIVLRKMQYGRPLNDKLTLSDYDINDGVSLDLTTK